MRAKLLSHVQLFVAHQAPLPMEFSRQEYWSGLPCPPPGDLPNPGMQPKSPASPALVGTFFTTSTTWECINICKALKIVDGMQKRCLLHCDCTYCEIYQVIGKYFLYHFLWKTCYISPKIWLLRVPKNSKKRKQSLLQ